MHGPMNIKSDWDCFRYG